MAKLFTQHNEMVVPESQAIPNGLKNRITSAAKEFNFTTKDIGHVETVLHDRYHGNSGRETNHMINDDVKVRFEAAMDKYKFTPQEIATANRVVSKQKSNKAYGHNGGFADLIAGDEDVIDCTIL